MTDPATGGSLCSETLPPTSQPLLPLPVLPGEPTEQTHYPAGAAAAPAFAERRWSGRNHGNFAAEERHRNKKWVINKARISLTNSQSHHHPQFRFSTVGDCCWFVFTSLFSTSPWTCCSAQGIMSLDLNVGTEQRAGQCLACRSPVRLVTAGEPSARLAAWLLWNPDATRVFHMDLRVLSVGTTRAEVPKMSWM